MKKRNFETKIITGLLTAGMILSLTACGSSSNGSYGISDLMDADYAVASKEAAAPEASAYEDGFGCSFSGIPLYGVALWYTVLVRTEEDGTLYQYW